MRPVCLLGIVLFVAIACVYHFAWEVKRFSEAVNTAQSAPAGVEAIEN